MPKSNVTLFFYKHGKDVLVTVPSLHKFLVELGHEDADEALMDMVKNYQNHIDGIGMDSGMKFVEHG